MQRVTTVAGAVLFAFSTAWFVIGLGHVWSHPLVGWLPLPVITLLGAYSCLRVAWRDGMAEPVRRFWRDMGSGCGLLFAAVISNTYDALGHGAANQRIGALTSALYVGAVAIAMWALLRLPAGRRTAGEWARFALDSGIVVLASGVAMWHFSLRGMSAWSQKSGSVVPVLCVIVIASVSIIALVKVAFAGTGGLDRGSLRLLSAGTALATVSGAALTLLNGRAYLSLTILAVPIGLMALILAATRQLTAGPGLPRAAPVGRRISVLPYLAVAGMDALLLATQSDGDSETWLIVLTTVALTALVAARQLAALRENARLLTRDTLTGTANRTLFAQQVTDRLATGERFHVALLDLDDFKEINDRLGHGTGDALLRAVTQRLHEGLRAADTVARLGGDEFTLLLPGMSNGEVAALLQRLVDHVQRPLLLDGVETVARISVGVTESAGGDCPEELIRRADVAMYAAKHSGGGRWTWFDSIMDRVADLDARLAADLRHAIDRAELSVVYQPIVELPTGRISGVEALVRWNHPDHGPVSPEVFIPLAERNGFIVELGRWILEQVVAQAAAWRERFAGAAPETVSVNISARQLREPGFAVSVAAMLAAAGLDPGHLLAEVTETAVLGTGAGLDAVRELHAMGLRVALDDFGTGQSSLSLLVSCPVDVLKVDKSFVAGVTDRSPQAVVVDALIAITDGLGVRAIAEGVETAEQSDRLYQVGYRYAQGFHFARPVPAEHIDALLADMAVPSS
ncbi:putative bifunctional diguanylate cyclase/phosphodiesterase [Actinoplanes sp. NPDC049265]|uniref:putative bifunctional diguanylate cyclase/phosphodiesterase n=1 Tax=Actinoplanes sp. NPDC049265 TaxID=3363902 RepID=UPI003720E04E